MYTHCLSALVALVALFFQPPFSSVQDDTSGPENKSEQRDVQVTTMFSGLRAGASGLAVDQEGYVYMGDWGPTWSSKKVAEPGTRIWKLQPGRGGKSFANQTHGAAGTVLDSDGNLYQSSFVGSFITKFDSNGNEIAKVDKGVDRPVGIALDREGNLLVCRCWKNDIVKVSPNGKTEQFCKSPLLKNPFGIACDQDGNTYVSNSADGLIIKITPEAEATELAVLSGGNGHLVLYEDYLYVAARMANQIFRVSLDGTEVTRLAGTGEIGKQDGSGKECSFTFPIGIAISPDGTQLYVSEPTSTGPFDQLNPTRIRIIQLKTDD